MENKDFREEISNVIFNKQLPRPLKVLEIDIIFKQKIKQQRDEMVKEIEGMKKEYKSLNLDKDIAYFVYHFAYARSGYNQAIKKMIEKLK